MKHKLQTMLKHNWRTLLLLLTLITTSQGAWAWNELNKRFYYLDISNNTSWGGDGVTMKLGLNSNDGCGGSYNFPLTAVTKCGDNLYYVDTGDKKGWGIRAQRYKSSCTNGVCNETCNATGDSNNTCVKIKSNDWNGADIGVAPSHRYIVGPASKRAQGWTVYDFEPMIKQSNGSYVVELCALDDEEKDFKVNEYNYWDSNNTTFWDGCTIGTCEGVSARKDGNGKVKLLSTHSNPVFLSINGNKQIIIKATQITTNSSPTSVSASGATLKGTVTQAYSSGTVGIVYSSTSSTPTVGGSGCSYSAASSYTSGSEYSVSITGLSAGTRYYYRAYFTVSGTTYYGSTTYTFYTKPDNIYIKGLIIYDGSGCDWPYDNTAFSKDGNVFTKTITARKPGCSYSNVNADAEFILTTTQGSDDGKLNAKATFVADGDNANWSTSTRTGDHDEKFNFKYTADYNAGDQVLITVTFVSDGTFKMRLQPACSLPSSVTPSADTQCLTYNGSNVSTTLRANASGGESFAYAWTVSTNPGNNASVSPDNTANTTATFAADGTYVFTATASCPSGNVSETVTVNVYSITQYAVTSSADAAVCPGTSVTLTLANTQSGYTYELYKDDVVVPNSQQERSATGSITWNVSPTATSTYKVKAWKTDCDNVTKEMSNSVTVTVKGDMAISAEKTSGITPYEPVEVTVTGTSVSNITLSAGSDGAALYNTTTKLPTTTTTTGTAVNFKAPAGTHTVTVTAMDAGCA